MCRGSHLDLKVASKDNKWFRNAALKQDRIVIETRATLNVAAMIGADMNYIFYIMTTSSPLPFNTL